MGIGITRFAQGGLVLGGEEIALFPTPPKRVLMPAELLEAGRQHLVADHAQKGLRMVHLRDGCGGGGGGGGGFQVIQDNLQTQSSPIPESCTSVFTACQPYMHLLSI